MARFPQTRVALARLFTNLALCILPGEFEYSRKELYAARFQLKHDLVDLREQRNG